MHLPLPFRIRLRASARLPIRLSPGSSLAAIFFMYFFAYLALRLSMPAAPEWDEAEIILLSRELSAGYGSQPPLYAWLQWLCFETFGLNRASLLGLKTALIMATYFFMFRLACCLLDLRAALVAAAALALLPEIGWGWLLDRTHSILVTALAGASLWTYFVLIKRPDNLRFLLLGLLMGCGLQAKYNYAVLLAGMLGASLIVKEHRRIVWQTRLWLTLGVAVLVLLPHTLWLADHVQEASGTTLNSLAQGKVPGQYWRSLSAGLADLGLAMLEFGGLLLAVCLLLAARRTDEGHSSQRVHGTTFQSNANLRFLCWLLACSILQLVLLVIGGHASNFRSRWMLPLLFFLPVVLLLAWPRLQETNRLHRLKAASLCVALLAMMALPARLFWGSQLGRPAPAHQPYPELAKRLRSVLPATLTVVSNRPLLLAQLRLAQPAWTVRLWEEARDNIQLPGPALLLVMQDPNARQRLALRTPCAPLPGSHWQAEVGEIRMASAFNPALQSRFSYRYCGPATGGIRARTEVSPSRNNY